ncbi:uncharacterized protein UTRI_00681 [Ustilago trichophora]|uniref:Uncharacterized protein n=1 Tax=Ustilago trichophora TaxID=86804 RepID=A0A5C3DRY5_9BASI|nr:uncharacterized protein UTRI_00681 [Ustilago trichophora]
MFSPSLCLSASGISYRCPEHEKKSNTKRTPKYFKIHPRLSHGSGRIKGEQKGKASKRRLAEAVALVAVAQDWPNFRCDVQYGFNPHTYLLCSESQSVLVGYAFVEPCALFS